MITLKEDKKRSPGRKTPGRGTARGRLLSRADSEPAASQRGHREREELQTGTETPDIVSFTTIYGKNDQTADFKCVQLLVSMERSMLSILNEIF